jgi:hypothetical protein
MLLPASANLLQFHLKTVSKQFVLFGDISKFQKWFYVDVLDFKFSFDVDFWLFWLGDCLGYFYKNWVNF